MGELQPQKGHKDPSGWYDLVSTSDSTLVQGDFINDVGVPVMPPALNSDDQMISLAAEYHDVVVLSQSCDLDHGKLRFALVAPYLTLAQAREKYDNILGARRQRERLRQGLIVGYHPLNKCTIPGNEHDFLVVSFREAFTVPLSYLFDRAAEQNIRLRLCSPYREHLAQAYARFIMRIGLPVDIPDLG